jgi:DNA repair protein RadC
MPGQRPIIRSHLDPSAAPAIVTHAHPLGDHGNSSPVCLSHTEL